MKKLQIIAAGTAAFLCVSACKQLDDTTQLTEPKADVSTASTFGSGPEQIWVDKAKQNFRNGEYGLAERYYRQAIEERHSNVEAWLGLAASYDHLKRFEEADRAYEVIGKMAGNTPTVLNNLGYHYMLKGDFTSAEKALQTAQAQDPNNPLIRANIALLADWKAGAGRRG